MAESETERPAKMTTTIDLATVMARSSTADRDLPAMGDGLPSLKSGLLLSSLFYGCDVRPHFDRGKARTLYSVRDTVTQLQHANLYHVGS